MQFREAFLFFAGNFGFQYRVPSPRFKMTRNRTLNGVPDARQRFSMHAARRVFFALFRSRNGADPNGRRLIHVSALKE